VVEKCIVNVMVSVPRFT